MDDRNFTFFRKNGNYKKCLLQLNNDFKEEKLIGPGVSFVVKEQGDQTDKILSHLVTRENVMKLPMLQLKDIMYLMANAKIDIVQHENILTYLDEKCAVSVDRWNLDFCLYILDAWLIILGPKAFRKHYYIALTNLLNKKLKNCSKYNFILTLYLIALSKKSPPFLKELVEYKIEKFIPDFTDEEMAVICLSFFKTSTKIDSELLLKQCSTVAENLVYKNDRFNLISILKYLRLSKYFDPNLINIIDDYIKKEYASFNFVECTNFLAFLATKNVYRFETYKCIENHGMYLLSKEDSEMEFNKKVEKMHPSERVRVKDLARFLWGMSFVGHNIKEESVDFIIHMLNTRLNSAEFESHSPILIDCFQSLVLFGYYPTSIRDYVLNPSFFKKILNINKAKPKYQLYFISRSAYIENSVHDINSMKFMNNIPKSLEKDIVQREGFQELINYLNNHLGKDSFMYCYIMPHIMISGVFIALKPKENNSDRSITSKISKLIENGIISKCVEHILQKDKIYACIELLDESVCAYQSVMPLGLMKAKIRQLQKLGIDVITVTPEEVKDLTKSGEHKCLKLQSLIL